MRLEAVQATEEKKGLGMAVRPVHETGTDQLLLTVNDGIARITFNNIPKRNALTVEVQTVLPGLLQALQDNTEVRVVVLTGAGTDAFVSGGDISEFEKQRTSPAARTEYDRTYARYRRAWEVLEKPVIAMIRGFCLGGGLLLALKADIRITAEDGQFGIPAARLGLGYGPSGIRPLIDVVGPAWTSEIMFTGRRFSAEEALRMGLVNNIVPADQLELEVDKLAARIRDNAPLTVASCKVTIREELKQRDQQDVARVEQLVEDCFLSEDYKEGQRAFAEKRQPQFKGR